MIQDNMTNMKVAIKTYKLQSKSINPTKIIQLSDLHLGYNLKKNYFASIIDKVLAMKPDLVFLTGDLIEEDIKSLTSELEPLRQLSAIDTYFILGNHDFQYNLAEEVLTVLKSFGVKPLINESVWIGGEQTGFNLAGVSDRIAVRCHYPVKYHPNIDRTLQDTRKGFPTILLSHRPIKRYMDEHPEIDLMISGHLHGGQIFPVGYLVLLIKEDSGEKLALNSQQVGKNRYIHVSKGLGYTRLPFRFLVTPEINLIELSPP